MLIFVHFPVNFQVLTSCFSGHRGGEATVTCTVLMGQVAGCFDGCRGGKVTGHFL